MQGFSTYFWHAIRINSKGKSKGGIAFYVSNSLNVEVEELSVLSQYFQVAHLWTLADFGLYCINIYIPPKGLVDTNNNI